MVRLTVKLRGRTEAPDGAEGAQFLSARGAKCAKPEAPHGALQRLLDAHSSDDVMTTAAVEGVADSWRRIHGQADHMPLC